MRNSRIKTKLKIKSKKHSTKRNSDYKNIYSTQILGQDTLSIMKNYNKMFDRLNKNR